MSEIRKILIANRGEIARRIMRTSRELGVRTVAVFSEPDRDAIFVSEADEAVALGGSTPGESYLRIDAIVAAAKKTGCDAVHPGYGFLAENADFARACGEQGLTFIGPSPEAIAAMGSKIEAKRRMQAADVPVLPSIDAAGHSDEELAGEAAKIGWPVLLKASAGGGGRGMRIVREADQFAAALESARREAESAFGDGSLFIEPYIERSRHVEIQIFGDSHGNVVHLFERECSIQRRHQKIVEETPSPVVDDKLRQAMGDAAVRAAKAIGYVNAGTVEFLLKPDGEFYFLEVNTRLQVEHPVTECVTGLDLVRLQIDVAAGQPLSPQAQQAELRGHAIEVRLYAEDPAQDFMPVTGRLHRFRIPEGDGVRVESAVQDGSEVSPFYDSMLAKVIVHAPRREEAARWLATVLSNARIHGLRTNRELLVRLLEHPEFLDRGSDTQFLERCDLKNLGAPLGDGEVEKLHAVAAALASQAERRAHAEVLPSIPSGWRNNPSQFQQARFAGRSEEISVEYRWQRDQLLLQIDGEVIENVRVGDCDPSAVGLQIDGVLRNFEVHHVDDTFYVDSPLGSSELRELGRFPSAEEEAEAGSLLAPLPGVVNDVKVQVGDAVEAGDVLIVIESMKMLHRVAAPVTGRVAELRVEASHHVEAGTVLAVIEEDGAA